MTAIVKSIKSRSELSEEERKFYDDVLRYKTLIENSNIDKEREFIRRKPYIKMLKAKSVYSLSREKITPSFKQFIDENVGSMEDYKDFIVFCELFEAVVAFSSMYVHKN
jgi:CRISPR type III-A-associated protein Csm2